MPCTIIVLSTFLKELSTLFEIPTMPILCILSFSLFLMAEINLSNDINNSKEYFERIDEIVSWLDENTKEEDDILVLGNEAVIYNKSNRRYSGKFFFQSPMSCSEKLADQVITEIKTLKPEYIVINSYELSNEGADIKINELLESSYTKIEDFVYIRRDEDE